MKRLFLFTIISFVAIFFYTSCDNEPLSNDIVITNPSNPSGVDVNQEQLIGTWRLSSVDIDVDQNISGSLEGQNINVTQNLNISQQSGDINLVLLEDGQYTSTGTADLLITGQQDGVPIDDVEENDVETIFGNSGSWSLNNAILTLTNADGNTAYTINAFSTDNMGLTTQQSIPGINDFFDSTGLGDISTIPGFEDFPDLQITVDQTFDSDFVLSKIE